ncbi:hypothetical protein ACQHIV_15880 [Kribbella sp. GL6]|uniref:hypothetical protein n=1 Tax=Kribbella sp. GL6 TaxID=3419765 RepID=UPI003D08CDD6
MSETVQSTEEFAHKCDACGTPIPEGRRLCGLDTGDAFCQAPEDYAHGYDLGMENAVRDTMPREGATAAELAEAIELETAVLEQLIKRLAQALAAER